MSAADHLRRARDCADHARFLEGWAYTARWWRRRFLLRRAEVLAQMAHAEAAIAWASIVDDPDLPHPGEYVAPVRGVPEPTPLEDYRPPSGLGRFKRTAPASPGKPAGAADTNPHQED